MKNKTIMNIECAFKFFKKYIDTYPDQPFWKSYSEDTWINDILYGLGVSLHHSPLTDTNPNSFATGFDKFKLELIKRFDDEGLLKKYLEQKKTS